MSLVTSTALPEVRFRLEGRLQCQSTVQAGVAARGLCSTVAQLSFPAIQQLHGLAACKLRCRPLFDLIVSPAILSHCAADELGVSTVCRWYEILAPYFNKVSEPRPDGCVYTGLLDRFCAVCHFVKHC